MLRNNLDIPSKEITDLIGLSENAPKKERISKHFDDLLALRKESEHLKTREVVDLIIKLAELGFEKGEIMFAYDEINQAKLKMLEIVKHEQREEHPRLTKQELDSLYEQTEQYKKIELIECRILVRQKKTKKKV